MRLPLNCGGIIQPHILEGKKIFLSLHTAHTYHHNPSVPLNLELNSSLKPVEDLLIEGHSPT